eukprot:5046859-Amphidinium_carterae.1
MAGCIWAFCASCPTSNATKVQNMPLPMSNEEMIAKLSVQLRHGNDHLCLSNECLHDMTVRLCAPQVWEVADNGIQCPVNPGNKSRTCHCVYSHCNKMCDACLPCPIRVWEIPGKIVTPFSCVWTCLDRIVPLFKANRGGAHTPVRGDEPCTTQRGNGLLSTRISPTTTLPLNVCALDRTEHFYNLARLDTVD